MVNYQSMAINKEVDNCETFIQWNNTSNQNTHNKGKSQNILISRETDHQRVHTTCFHLYVVQNKQPNLH